MKNIAIIVLFSFTIISVFSIQVSGNQSGTWTPTNNPYEVIGDVTVPTGTTLTVLPGVLVQAMGNYQIIAQGNIIAIGTVQDSIFFVSGQTDPTALWKGIRLENTTVQSQFSYCRIDLGDYGINSISSPASITYCHFKNNKRGIQAYGIGSTNPAAVLIDHNLIELTVQNGILVAQNSNTTITYNEITRNGTSASYYGAIQLSNQSAGGSNNPEIAYNHIHHNFKQGIIAWDIVGANAIMPEVHHNLVENNLTGIYFRHSSGYLHHNTIINNFIPGDMNSGAGVMVSGNTAEPYFEDNIVTGNYTGFYLTENAQPCLGNLMIYHAWAQGGNTIANNIDANNVMHSVFCYSYTNGDIIVSAENNFWDYNTATEIAGTIEDHNDNATLPTVDFDPWQNNPIPIYLAGTVTYTNPPVPTATLELVSADTGDVLNTWTVNINEPFSVPVYHDSLAYIVAHTSDVIMQLYYGAYGGTDNPTATQIIADVQFNIGNLPISTPQPDWNYYKVGAPETINGHLSYPLKKGWFVYKPTEIFWLFRDGDYLKISQITSLYNGNYESFQPASTPVWRRIAQSDSVCMWGELLWYSIQNQTVHTDSVSAYININTNTHGLISQYDKIYLDMTIKLIDHYNNRWYIYYWNMPMNVTDKFVESPVLVEPDGTFFPLVQNNYWKILTLPVQPEPSYFGYTMTDSHINFYWIPFGYWPLSHIYHIYDNDILIASPQWSQNNYSIPIPQAPSVHTYTLAGYDSGTAQEYFSESSITLTFTNNEDEVQPVSKLSVFPNPFNPLNTSLTVKYDFPKSADAKVAVYNLKGQLVWNAFMDKSATEMVWSGKDKQGKLCASGLYQIRLTDAKGRKLTRKFILLH